MIATLLLAQGTPMLCAGDEIGNSQGGNNNAYCQDNPTGWLDWSDATARSCSSPPRPRRLRRSEPLLHHGRWFAQAGDPGHGPEPVLAHARRRRSGVQDWHDVGAHALACLIDSGFDLPAEGSSKLLLLFNPEAQEVPFALPEGEWTLALDSSGVLARRQGTLPRALAVPAHALDRVAPARQPTTQKRQAMNLDQRRMGVLLHITSLPGPHGIGDFGPRLSLRRLAARGRPGPVAVAAHHADRPGDSPYQSKSAFAGSPLMVALEPLVERGWLPPPELPEGGFRRARGGLRARDPVAPAAAARGGERVPAKGGGEERADFESWCEKQAHWLGRLRAVHGPRWRQRHAPVVAVGAAAALARGPGPAARARRTCRRDRLLEFRAVAVRCAVRAAAAVRAHARRARDGRPADLSSPTTVPTCGRARTCISSARTSPRAWLPACRRTNSGRWGSAGAILFTAGTACKQRDSPGGRRA
jgi:hypothetical protein